MNNKEQGNVLLYALLIIAAILSTTIVISNFIQSSIKQAGFISNAQAAYYSAESGAEKLLYIIRKQDTVPKQADCQVKNADCEWKIDQKQISELNLDLAQNQTLQFDLFNPESNIQTSKVESISFEWAKNGAWLEISTIAWEAQQNFQWPEFPNLAVQKMLYSGGSATDNFFAANKNYQVRIKALYAPANDLKIKLYSLDNKQGQEISFPNFLKLKTFGSFDKSSQIINVDMARYSPMIGLFDYVLFSEEAIQK